jgi:hypothetical protein
MDSCVVARLSRGNMTVGIKKISSGMALSVLLVVGFTQPVAAHELKISNGTSAVLHVLPNDQPVAGDTSEMDFSFGASKSGFELATCDCSVSVTTDAGKTLVKKLPLTPSAPGATLTSVVPYTFTKAGVYDVLVRGKATAGQFKDFSLDYDVTVSSPEGSVATADITAVADRKQIVGAVIAGGLVVMFIVVLNVVRRSSRYNK